MAPAPGAAASSSPATGPAAPADVVSAPGDIYPRNEHERQLCDQASHPDWLYLGALALLDAGSITYGSAGGIQDSSNTFVRYSAPTFVGLTWGATIGGGWLALPRCDPHYVDVTPREGDVRANWPVALSLALLGGATAPMINGILVGNQPQDWTNEERSAHVITAGVAGFVGALLPYLLPPSSWSAANELRHLRLGVDARAGGGVTVGLGGAF